MPVGPQVRIRGKTAGVSSAEVRRAVQAAWRVYGGAGEGTVEVAFLDAVAHTEVHARFLADSSETDVLAFPYGDRDLHGEILVNRDLAAREAERRQVPVAAETLLYVVHGALHLLGFEDKAPAARIEMRRAEEHIMEVLGIPSSQHLA